MSNAIAEHCFTSQGPESVTDFKNQIITLIEISYTIIGITQLSRYKYESTDNNYNAL